MKKRVLSAMPSQTFAEGALDAAQQTGKLSYDGYKKVWSDEFNGDSLNRADWNVETHEKGWVNNELQEYVDSAENIQVKDGKLIINPVKKVTDGDTGSTKEAASYTSGRVSTQNKQTF
jgi:beta-glucanase (GH16 family)